MARKSIPENERIYVVFNFCDTIKDFTLSEHIKGWRGGIEANTTNIYYIRKGTFKNTKRPL